MDQAHEDCGRALKLDPSNRQLLSLQAELQRPKGPQTAESILQCAQARFASGQYSAAADAFRSLERLHGNEPVKLASAHSNRGMCLLCMHHFDEALNACQEGFKCVTDLESFPLGSVETTLAVLEGKLQVTGAAQVAMKCVGRMAACLAHKKEFREAERLYLVAAGIAEVGGNPGAAEVFQADADQMKAMGSEAQPVQAS